MLEEVMLVSYPYYGGGTIGQILSQWEQYGFFSIILPFLLIFALVFGILEKTNVFKDNRSVNGIIALVVGLMSLQFPFVTVFFSEIFWRLGVALSIILVVLIILGIFIPKKSWVTYALFGIGVIILIVTLVNTAGAVGWYSGYWWYDNWPLVAGAIFIIAVIGTIIGASQPRPANAVLAESPLMKSLFGIKDT